MDYKLSPIFKANRMFDSFREEPVNEQTRNDAFISSQFLKLKTGSEIAIYIFEHTKCTLLDEAKTEKIFMKILSTKNDLSYILGSMLKLMGNHLISQNINYHILYQKYLSLLPITELLITTISIIIAISNQLIIDESFLNQAIENKKYYSKAFWTLCLVIRKQEIYNNTPVQLSLLMKFDLFGIVTKIIIDYESNNVSDRTIHIIYKVLLNTIDDHYIGIIQEKYSVIIEGSMHFGISFVEAYLFSFLFTDENNFPDLLEIPINSDMQKNPKEIIVYNDISDIENLECFIEGEYEENSEEEE